MRLEIRKIGRAPRYVLLSLLLCVAMGAVAGAVAQSGDLPSLAGIAAIHEFTEACVPVIRWSLAGMTVSWALFYRKRPR